MCAPQVRGMRTVALRGIDLRRFSNSRRFISRKNENASFSGMSLEVEKQSALHDIFREPPHLRSLSSNPVVGACSISAHKSLKRHDISIWHGPRALQLFNHSIPVSKDLQCGALDLLDGKCTSLHFCLPWTRYDDESASCRSACDIDVFK